MLGLMQEWPLLCQKILDHAAIAAPERAIVSRSVEGAMHRTTYPELRRRALQLAKRLDAHGIGFGDRVATLAWNTWRHLEIWYGSGGLGAVCHTVNPRLFPDQIAWIVNDAGDRLLFVDLTFLPLAEKLAPSLPLVEKVIVMADSEHMPQTTLANAVAMRNGSPRSTAISPGPPSTSTPLPACATRRARPATRRGSSTPTARTSSTP
jgi:fatty-acyl-CoA synthase